MGSRRTGGRKFAGEVERDHLLLHPRHLAGAALHIVEALLVAGFVGRHDAAGDSFL